MSLLAPTALAGMVLLPGIILLHLLRSRPRRIVVSSTILWQQVGQDVSYSRRPWSRPRSPLLLILQLLMIGGLIFALAQPATTAAAPRWRVFILDTSVRMRSTDVRPTRFVAARQAIRHAVEQETPGTTISIILSGAPQPRLVIASSDKNAVLRTIDRISPESPGYHPSDLRGAVRLAGELVQSAGANLLGVTVARAREDPLPATAMSGFPAVSSIVVGHSTDNQGIFHFTARCRAGVPHQCLALAQIHNEARGAVSEPIIVLGNGDLLARKTLSLPGRAVIAVTFAIPAGVRALELQLGRPDILAADNRAWTIVPDTTVSRVLLISNDAGGGTPAPLQRALSRIAGVKLRAIAPNQYRPADAQASDLVVVDRWLPRGSLPPAPAVALVDPPSSPAIKVVGVMADVGVAGEETGHPLLSGVDLASLSIETGASEVIAAPDWMAPVVWTADGALIAAGNSGTQNVVLLAFDIGRSNLAQLNAFPLLMRNLVHWTTTTLPLNVVVGETILLTPPPGTRMVIVDGVGLKQVLTLKRARPLTFTVAQPGIYSVEERGSWGITTRRLAANVSTDQSTLGGIFAGLDQFSLHGGRAGKAPPAPLWPWAGVVALLFVVGEWAYYALRA